MTRAEALRPGQLVKAAFGDCCVAGEFTARVQTVCVDPDYEDFVEALTFDNGVRLETPMHGVHFEVLEEARAL